MSCGAFEFDWAVLIAVWGCFVSCLIVLFSLLCFSLVVLFVYVRLWWGWLFAWAYGCGLLCLLCLRCRCRRCEFSVCLLRFVVGVCLLLGWFVGDAELWWFVAF